MALELLSEYYKLAKKSKKQSSQIFQLRKELVNLKDKKQTSTLPSFRGKQVLIQEQKDKLKKELDEQKSLLDE